MPVYKWFFDASNESHDCRQMIGTSYDVWWKKLNYAQSDVCRNGASWRAEALTLLSNPAGIGALWKPVLI